MKCFDETTIEQATMSEKTRFWLEFFASIFWFIPVEAAPIWIPVRWCGNLDDGKVEVIFYNQYAYFMKIIPDEQGGHT